MNEETEEVSQPNLEQLIEQRNSLFKKAMDAKGTHMQVRTFGTFSCFFLYPMKNEIPMNVHVT